jgi:hypothetical protein
MRLTIRYVVAFSAAFALAGTAAAKEVTYGVTEETAVVGAEAAAVLLGSVEDTAVVGARSAAVLLEASQPADSQLTGKQSAPTAAKARANAKRGVAKAARSTN